MFSCKAFGVGRITLVGMLCFVAHSSLATVTQWADMRVDRGHLKVDVEIAGTAGVAIIDTGAQLNGINASFLRNNDSLRDAFKKGRSINLAGVHETVRRPTYDQVPVRLFNSDLVFNDVAELSLSRNIQFVIGAGFLENLIFQFDYPNQRLRAMTRDAIDLKALKNIQSRRNPQSGAPMVKVRLNNEKDVWLLLDTGSSGGLLLPRNIAVRQKWLERYPSELRRSRGANSSGQMQRFNIEVMQFGPYELESPIVSVPAEGESPKIFEKRRNTLSRIRKGRSNFDGLLGYDILKHFVLTIDYKRGWVHVATPEET